MKWWFIEVFSLLYILTFLIGLFSVAFRFFRPGGRAERNRTRWFLITAFIGAMPFVLLYKVPALFGIPSFIPMVLIMAFGIVTPIGWGMAVASFRMFKLEWVLSRTITYFLTAIIVIIILFISSSIGLNYSTSHDLFSLLFLIVIGLVLTFLTMSGLIGQVRNLVDRIYYGDWFNYREEDADADGRPLPPAQRNLGRQHAYRKDACSSPDRARNADGSNRARPLAVPRPETGDQRGTEGNANCRSQPAPAPSIG